MSHTTIDLTQRLRRALHEPDFDIALDNDLYPLVPFSAEGMPPAGPDFIAHAIQLGDDIDPELVAKKKLRPETEKLVALYRCALYDPEFTLAVGVKSKKKQVPVKFLPGHIIGPDKRGAMIYGPRKKAQIMVVGKIPGRKDLEARNATVSAGIQILAESLAALGVTYDAWCSWYFTSACKFGFPSEDMTVAQASWFRDCALLLEQEIRLIEPDYILCLGAEATKCVMGTAGSVARLNGRVLVRPSFAADGSERDIAVVPVMHPAFVIRKPEIRDDFNAQLSKFVQLTTTGVAAETVDHADIYTEQALTELVDSMINDPTPNANIIAVDCEWHGDNPTEPGSYLRTVQVSNRDGWARNIVLRHQGGAVAFYPNLDAARTQLNRLLKSTETRHVRVGGHFLRADLPWLIDFGVDVREEYAPAADPDDRTRGGWDTSLLYHAVHECARFALDDCSLRFTSAPTYWEALDQWKKDYRAKHKKEVDGYGDCPGYILHPYGAYDADVTRRIMMKFYGTNGQDGLIANDENGQDCWRPYWIAHSSSLAFLEMEMTGLVLDRDRADKLMVLFLNAQNKTLAELRRALNWPEFNPKSQPQLAVALFGRQFGRKYTNPPNVPDDAQLLDMEPIKTTGKRPTLWGDLTDDARKAATPSTDRESLGILGHRNPVAAKIRDYKFLSQVLQSTLRRPALDDDGEFEKDDTGNFVYNKGLVGSAHADGRVRTHFFQTKETGRASSARPPLQNLSSRREDDYRRILGEMYQHPVRTILRVPDGYVGIETDYTGAELAVLAWLAQDYNMIEHVRRNILPPEHPDHYDIHAQQAVKAFNLTDIPPTKEGLVAAGKKGLRVAAKNVNFGIPYGRGAEAIARQCKEEGVSVTPKECQAMIDAYFNSYPGTADFLAECRHRSQNERFIIGPYGRIRRFHPIISDSHSDRAARGEQERQAQNFPIQGGVADAVSIALSNFYQYRREHPELTYKIVMQIHDAIVLMVPYDQAERVYKEVIPRCMLDGVPFYPRRLDGRPIPDAGPYHFGIDCDVFVHWGEKLTPAEAETYGLSWLFEK